MSNMENSQAKIERLNYNFYLILNMMEKSFKGFLSEVLPIIGFVAQIANTMILLYLFLLKF